MKTHLLAAILAATLIGVTGCAGSNFTRPAEGELTVGKATKAEVAGRMGDPMQTGELLKNDRKLAQVRYAYAAAGGESAYPGVTPARSMAFTFFNDTLTSKQFVSSFKSDSTDFDAAKSQSITKGKTTKQEVISLLGKPSGEAVYPFIKSAGDQAYIYSYVQAKGSVFNMKFYSKVLVISFDDRNIVTDVEFSSSGEQ